MKTGKLMTIVAAMLLCSVLTASAQFRFGVRLGTEVNAMRLDKSVFNNENRAGFTGGLMCEFTVPLIGLGFDLSAMYVHRVSQSEFGANASQEIKDILASDNFRKRDYIEIPLNLKYKIGLPVVGKIITPYIATGPSFSILASKKAITSAYQNKSFDIAWNVGVGVQLINHIQIGASYGIGLNKTIELVSKANTAPIEGKNNYWTITAAYLF